MPHVPVMVEQVVDAFRLCPAGDFVDGTLGMGGHAEALLKAYPKEKATLVGFDPTGEKFGKYYPDHITLFVDFFNSEVFSNCPVAF